MLEFILYIIGLCVCVFITVRVSEYLRGKKKCKIESEISILCKEIDVKIKRYEELKKLLNTL